MENLISHTLLVGMENVQKRWESLAVSFKSLLLATTGPSNCTPGELSQKTEVLCIVHYFTLHVTVHQCL